MNTYEYILSKQIQWARNHNIKLIGSKGNHGRPAYTERLEDNLFEPLSKKSIAEFQDGDGKELSDNPNDPAKMQAVHSSSAFAVNIFQYWQKINDVSSIACACGLCDKKNRNSCEILFEQKFPISKSFKFNPNLDVIIKNKPESQYKIYAIECKFSEAYSSYGHSGMDEKYFGINNIWKDIPNLYNLSITISPKDNLFNHLHPAQLIKHILALKKEYGKKGFRLLYLWYDTLGSDGYNHRLEIDRFKEIANKDGIKFHDLSYQALILKLSKEHRAFHQKYIAYITDRYL